MPAVAFTCSAGKPLNRASKTANSAIDRAAYIARETLEDTREQNPDERLKDYTTGHSEVLSSFIMHRPNAPEWGHDRQELWNSVEGVENRKNSQLAQELILSFPSQLNLQQCEWTLKDFVRDNYVRPLGVVADCAIHAPDEEGDQRNIHAHVLHTLRALNEDGWDKHKLRFGEKTSELEPDGKPSWTNARDERLEGLREDWANRCANMLERAGYSVEADRWRVGHLTKEEQRDEAIKRGDLEYAEQILDGPSVHLGPALSRMERDGIKTEIGDKLRGAGQQVGGPKVFLREAYEAADNPQAFQAAIAESGYVLARASAYDAENNPAEKQQHYQPKFKQGEYVAVNEIGHAYRLNFYRAADQRREVEEFLKPLDGVEMRDVSDTRADLLVAQAERTVTPRKEREAESKPFTLADAADAITKDKGELNETAGNIRMAYALSQGPEEFRELLAERGLHLARASYMDWQRSIVTASHAEHNDKYTPETHWNEYVVLNEKGKVYTLNSRSTGDRPEETQAFMAGLSGADVKDIATVRTEILGPTAEREIQTPAELAEGRIHADATRKVADTMEAGIVAGVGKVASAVENFALDALEKVATLAEEIAVSILDMAATAPSKDQVNAKIHDKEKTEARREQVALDLSRWLADEAYRAEVERQRQEQARQDQGREDFGRTLGRDR